jgi:hypothetical protein
MHDAEDVAAAEPSLRNLSEMRRRRLEISGDELYAAKRRSAREDEDLVAHLV